MRAITQTVVLALLVVGFAGCTGRPPAEIVDFSNVTENQSGADFQLRVKVVGVENGTTPIAGAFVGAAQGRHAIAKTVTDGDGVATLGVRNNQQIRIVAQANGWTTEDSGVLQIGTGSSEGTASCGIFVYHAWCVVTDGNASAEYALDGDSGQVSLVLFPRSVVQESDVTVTPRVNALVTVLPDSKKWFAVTKPLSDEPGLHDLHMLRLVDAKTTLSWKNEMLSQADFELGVSCDRDRVARQTANTAPRIIQPGVNTVTLDWKPPQSAWTDCDAFHAGPIVDSVTSDVKAHVKVQMVFEGHSQIIPIGTL